MTTSEPHPEIPHYSDLDKLLLKDADEGNGDWYALVPGDLYTTLHHESRAYRHLAERFDLPPATDLPEKLERLEDALDRRLDGPDDSPEDVYRDLAYLMRNWRKHVRVTWPDGVALTATDPTVVDDQGRIPQPRIQLSNTLETTLDHLPTPTETDA